MQSSDPVVAPAAPPSTGRIAGLFDWLSSGFSTGAMAAFMAHADGSARLVVVTWAVVGTVAGAGVLHTASALGRALGIRTHAEWYQAATPAQRREHRIAVTGGVLLLALLLALLFAW